jgi:hypothetical protein
MEAGTWQDSADITKVAQVGPPLTPDHSASVIDRIFSLVSAVAHDVVLVVLCGFLFGTPIQGSLASVTALRWETVKPRLACHPSEVERIWMATPTSPVT